MLLQDLLQSESFTTAAPRLRRGAAVYAPTFFASYVLAGLIAAGDGGRLIVAPDAEVAAALAAELAVYLERDVAVLPARGVLYGAEVAPAPHVVGQRQQALAALGAGGVVVVEAVAALERFLPLDLQPEPLRLAAGEEAPFDVTVERLAALGYGRVEQVRARGEFAVRGGLVDVYPSLGEPLRVEFWGDEVERLRTFSVYSQRTAATVDEAIVYAAFEADTGGVDFRGAVQRALAAWEDAGRDDAPDDMLRRAEVQALAGLAGRFTTLAACAAATDLPIVVVRPEETWRALADFAAEIDLVFGSPGRAAGADGGAPAAGEGTSALEGVAADGTPATAPGAPPPATAPGAPPPSGARAGARTRERLYVPLAEARALLARGLQLEVVRREQALAFAASRPQFAARDLAGAERDLARLVNDGYRVYVVFRHGGEAQRAAYRLRHLTAEVLETGEAGRPEAAAPGLYFLAAPLREGFVSAELKLAVIPERSLLRGPSRERRFVGGTRLASFFDVRPGDYVVHEDHGIARFAGVETRTVAGITRDYLLLQFRGDDRVFVPHEQIGKVSRYIGAGAGAPPLNKLGGTAWQAVKTRARTAVVEMAGELLQLYAARQAVPGFAFPPDGELTRRLEDAFPFEETEDQAEAIDEVKNDMEAPHPMDRLVCGDVGYGKTEVALRAAFKAAEGGRQSLVLVPTTILAQQHAVTFAERYEDLPVEVGMVSRFRTKAEQRDVLARFEKGDVDVLIGTHRLLSTDVRPKDLGLVVVDEEQRFGVRQKEVLRNLKLQTDVLSMSATPIPRTLQMSLSGIRDISVIETPPRGRHEVRTYIGEYRDDLVRAAIEKEVARGGQVFYLHNRVETIEEAAEHVQELAPKARLLVAHGRLHERALEKVMLAFLAGEADVLVTTSIIESGIDIPTANTLIVERADMLGLAQLYQIRGRIGRSDAYAYAYLLYPSEELLTSEAAARLTTLSDHTELGAGFRIAMADLEIRGAGNLLGDEQSGHVAAVGFEMYAQMLEEAVAELRGEPLAALTPVRLDVSVTAYVPPDYIAYEATKVDAHRRIARAATPGELGEVRAELADRFGAPPGPVENLLSLQALRIKAGELGLRSVSLRGTRLQLDGLELDRGSAARLRAALPRAVYLAQRAVLTVHGDGGAPASAGGGPPTTAVAEASPLGVEDELNERSQTLMWVEQILDAILDARVTADQSSDPGSQNP